MEETEKNYRPSVLLDDWLRHSGRSKRLPTGDTMVWALYETWQEDLDSSVSRWVPIAMSSDPLDALQQGYLEVIQRLRNDYEEGRKGWESTKLGAMVVMAYGEGAVRRSPDSDPNTPVDELDQELLSLSTHEPVPSRLVNLISMEGTAAETAMFFPHRDPLVERFEMWVGDDDHDPVVNGSTVQQGDLDHAMSATFTLLVLLAGATEDGLEPNMVNLARKAKEYEYLPGGEQVVALVRAFARQMTAMRDRLTSLVEMTDDLGGILGDE